MLFIIRFHEREVDVLGGNLLTTTIGVSAMAMGMAFSTIWIPQINFSTIAGPIVGSGLTLIAIGLQRYYEEWRTQAKCTSNPH